MSVRSSPSDDLINWNSGLSVCPCTKSFKIDLIQCVGRTGLYVCTSVTSTQSKVKIKVTELPKFRKLHFSRSISAALLAWSSKLMVDCDSIGPSRQLFGARFLKFLLTWVQASWNVDITGLSKGRISILLEARVTSSGVLVVCVYCACWCDLDPIQSQGQGHTAMTVSPLSGLLFCCVGFNFFSANPSDWLGRKSPKLAVLCQIQSKL